MYLFLAVLGPRCCAGFSLVVASGGFSLVAVPLIAVASLISEHRLCRCGLKSCGSWALEQRFNSCGLGLVVHCMWILHRSGIEPVSPALAHKFLTTAPPGNP